MHVSGAEHTLTSGYDGLYRHAPFYLPGLSGHAPSAPQTSRTLGEVDSAKDFVIHVAVT